MKTYLAYGLAMAVAGAVLVILLYLFDFHSDPAKLGTAQWIGMAGGVVIGAICISLGTRARRAEIPAHEEFGYGRALGAGFMITLFAALFGIGTTILYGTVINPEFADVIVQAQTEQMEARGMSAAQIEGAEKMIRRMTTPAIQAVFGFLSGMFMGTIISLVVAAFLKRPASDSISDVPPTLA